MPFSLMPGETVIHQVSGSHKGTAYSFNVTNRRLLNEETRWGSGTTTILPLDRIDSIQETRVSSIRLLVITAILTLASLASINFAGPFALLGVIPALICAFFWWLSLKQALVFATASAQVSLVLRGHSGGQEILEIVEAARQNAIREVNLPAPDPATPPQVTSQD